MFDMNQCKPGDKLISVHGMILEYVGHDGSCHYPHIVKYPNGSTGSRCDDGFVFYNKRLPEDENIIGFAPKDATP